MKVNKYSVWHILLIIICLIAILPVLFMIGNSFKTVQEAYKNPLMFIPTHPSFANYETLSSQLNIIRLISNTFVMAALVTFGKVFTGLLAAYAFKYHSFKGKKWIYFIFMATMFVPFTMTMIPNYLVISRLHLLNTVIGVVLPQLCDASGIMLFVRSMNKIPNSLIESAKLDNINDFRIFRNIVIPLLKPSIISVGAMFFINSWNEYVWPTLILKNTESFTLPLALQNYISSEGGTNFPLAMAVATIMIIPPLLIYIVLQKYILNNISNAGLK